MEATQTARDTLATPHRAKLHAALVHEMAKYVADAIKVPPRILTGSEHLHLSTEGVDGGILGTIANGLLNDYDFVPAGVADHVIAIAHSEDPETDLPQRIAAIHDIYAPHFAKRH